MQGNTGTVAFTLPPGYRPAALLFTSLAVLRLAVAPPGSTGSTGSHLAE
jgi:hypothetical protein